MFVVEKSVTWLLLILIMGMTQKNGLIPKVGIMKKLMKRKLDDLTRLTMGAEILATGKSFILKKAAGEFVTCCFTEHGYRRLFNRQWPQYW